MEQFWLKKEKRKKKKSKNREKHCLVNGTQEQRLRGVFSTCIFKFLKR